MQGSLGACVMQLPPCCTPTTKHCALHAGGYEKYLGGLRGELHERYHARRRLRRALLEAQQQRKREQDLKLRNVSAHARRMLMVGDSVIGSPDLRYGLQLLEASRVGETMHHACWSAALSFSARDI